MLADFNFEPFYKLINELNTDLQFIFENLNTSMNFLDIHLNIADNILNFDIYHKLTNSF